MKVYLFYLITKNSIHDKDVKHINLTVTEKYPYTENTFISLYGYTDNPSYAEKFRDERNEHKLILKKKKMSKEEYQEFSHKNFKLMINYYTLDTKGVIGGKYDIITIPILAPSIEIDYIKNYGVEDVFIQLNNFYFQYPNELIDFIRDPTIISKEIAFALNTIGMYTYLYYNDQLMLFENGLVDGDPEEFYNEMNICIDEVGLYINLFGDLY